MISASIILDERHDAFFAEITQDNHALSNPATDINRSGRLGKSFHGFCLSGIIYFCSTVMSCLTYVFLINGNGGINKRNANDDDSDGPASVPLHPLSNPNREY